MRCRGGCSSSSFYLFDACALLLVSIVGQFEVLCNVVIPGGLLDLNLLSEFEDFLLQLSDCLLGSLRVWGGIFTSWEWIVRPTWNSQGCLAQPTHLQPVDLKLEKRGGGKGPRGGNRGLERKIIGREKGRKVWVAYWGVLVILLTGTERAGFCIFPAGQLKEGILSQLTKPLAVSFAEEEDTTYYFHI